MSNLFVTENLEVITKKVSVRERFDNEDMMVLENGAYIPVTLRQGQGVIADFGTLLLKQRQVPCRWKKVRDITAVRLEGLPLPLRLRSCCGVGRAPPSRR